MLTAAGGRRLAGAGVVSRLAAHRGRRRVRVVQGGRGGPDGGRGRLRRAGAVSAGVRGRRAWRGPFRLARRRVETLAAELALAGPVGVAAGGRCRGHGKPGAGAMGQLARPALLHRGAAGLRPVCAAHPAAGRRRVSGRRGHAPRRLARSVPLPLVSARRIDARRAGRLGGGRLLLHGPTTRGAAGRHRRCAGRPDRCSGPCCCDGFSSTGASWRSSRPGNAARRRARRDGGEDAFGRDELPVLRQARPRSGRHQHADPAAGRILAGRGGHAGHLVRVGRRAAGA